MEIGANELNMGTKHGAISSDQEQYLTVGEAKILTEQDTSLAEVLAPGQAQLLRPIWHLSGAFLVTCIQQPRN